MSSFLLPLVIQRKGAQADDSCAMSLDQFIQGSYRIALTTVEQRFKSRNQIRQAEAHEAISRSRL